MPNPTLIRPTQSLMYVPLLVNRFQKIILRIVQYKYLKSCSGDFTLQNLILRTRSCGTGFVTQSSWVFRFRLTTMVMLKCFVPQLYQFRRGISGGAALESFYMIHRGWRSDTSSLEDPQDALICRLFSAKEPLIIGLLSVYSNRHLVPFSCSSCIRIFCGAYKGSCIRIVCGAYTHIRIFLDARIDTAPDGCGQWGVYSVPCYSVWLLQVSFA